MLGSRWVIDGAVAQDDVRRPERQVAQDGCHDSEECVGVRSEGVEDYLASSVLVSVELANAGMVDRVGQQGLGLVDDLPLAGLAEAVVGQSTASNDGMLNGGFCFA